jgi:hypothetical protein
MPQPLPLCMPLLLSLLLLLLSLLLLQQIRGESVNADVGGTYASLGGSRPASRHQTCTEKQRK